MKHRTKWAYTEPHMYRIGRYGPFVWGATRYALNKHWERVPASFQAFPVRLVTGQLAYLVSQGG